MSANFASSNCRLVGAHLTTAVSTTVFTAKGFVQVVGIRLANVSSNDTTATVSWCNAREKDEYRLFYRHTVPVSGQVWLPLEAFALAENDEIRVQTGNAGALDVILSIVEIPGRSG